MYREISTPTAELLYQTYLAQEQTISAQQFGALYNQVIPLPTGAWIGTDHCAQWYVQGTDKAGLDLLPYAPVIGGWLALVRDTRNIGFFNTEESAAFWAQAGRNRYATDVEIRTA